MKKWLISILIGVLLLLCACGGGESGPDPQPSAEPEPPDTLLPFTSYNLDTYLRPYWKGTFVYNETVLFLGESDAAKLMYDPDEIIAVLSYDLSTVYEEGVDYIIEDNMIKLIPNSSIPYFTYEEYYPETAISGKTFPCTVPGRMNIMFGEGTTMTSRQIAVTYSHSKKWERVVPENQSSKFQGTISKLENKEPIKILFYGDSITTGSNSSGKVGTQPMAETYPQMIKSYLKKKYSYDDIQYTNTAVGGKNSDWAIENVQSLVIDHNPDLIFLAFGMNDRVVVQQYSQKTNTLIQMIKSALPQAEIMLVSPMLPNQEVAGFYNYQYLFEEQLQTIAQGDQKIGIAKVTSMHKELLKRKRYRDMTGNNVNHPNDFLARLYAQTIIASMLGEISLTQ